MPKVTAAMPKRVMFSPSDEVKDEAKEDWEEAQSSPGAKKVAVLDENIPQYDAYGKCSSSCSIFICLKPQTTTTFLDAGEALNMAAFNAKAKTMKPKDGLMVNLFTPSHQPTLPSGSNSFKSDPLNPLFQLNGVLLSADSRLGLLKSIIAEKRLPINTDNATNADRKRIYDDIVFELSLRVMMQHSSILNPP